MERNTRKAQHALVKSEERYRHIFQSTYISLWEQDIRKLNEAIDRVKKKGVLDFRKYLDTNPEFLTECSQSINVIAVNDYTVELYEADGKDQLTGPLSNLLGPASLDILKQEIIAIADGMPYFESEAVNKTFKGNTIHILMRITIPDILSRHQSLLVSVIDITKIKNVEKSLNARIRRQEIITRLGLYALEGMKIKELMELAMENIAESLDVQHIQLFEFSPDKQALNLRASHGWSGNESVIFNPSGTTDHPGPAFTDEFKINQQALTNNIQLEPEDGTDAVSRTNVMIKDQTGFWGALVVHNFKKQRFNQDDINFLQAIANILSETILRFKREESLICSEEKFRSLLEFSPDGMVIVNARGVIEIVNKQLEEMTGYVREELLGQPIEILVPERFKNHLNFRNQYLDDPLLKKMEARNGVFLKCKDGAEIPVEVSLNPLVTDDGLIVSAEMRDIRDRTKAEEKLRQSEKLAATGRMAARIAHEINNPLAGIKSSFQLVKEGIPKDFRYYKYAELIDKEINRIAEIIRQMYILYQPKQSLAGPFPINDAIRDIIALLDSDRNTHKPDIKTELFDSPAVVNLPDSLMRQILYNLILNAIEATPKNGSVLITTRIDGPDLVLKVSNEGDRIPDDIRNRIFEPFFTTKTDSNWIGLGLGLSVCKTSVEALGGSLDLLDDEHDCTVFQLIFPINTA